MRKSIYQSKRYPREKKYKVLVYIPEKYYKELMEIAEKMFPDLIRGRISQTIVMAIEFFLAHYQGKNIEKVNPRPSVEELAREVQKAIVEERGILPKDIIHKALRASIMHVRRIKTKRRADAWAYRMYIEGIIKPRKKGKIKPETIEDDMIWEWVLRYTS